MTKHLGRDLNDIADPSDWRGTPVASLGPVEIALRCQVCKEFFSTPMITSCSHTFCSLCIRRCLSNDGKCPACRAQDQPMKLRRNWAVEELVQTFDAARPEILNLATQVTRADQLVPVRGPKRKHDEFMNGYGAFEEDSQRKTRSQSRKVTAKDDDHTDTMIRTAIEYEKSEENNADSGTEPQPDDGLVSCPLCHRRMKEAQVFPHLDSCGQQHGVSTLNPGLSSVTSSKHSNLPSAQIEERLPTLNYSLLSETALRKKLSGLGIPNTGNKAALEARHQEWVNLWNANCDSSRPHNKRQLLRELELWDKTHLGKRSESTAAIMSKEFDGNAYISENQDSFQQLITQARKRISSSKSQQAETHRDDVKAVENVCGIHITSEHASDPNSNHSGLPDSAPT